MDLRRDFPLGRVDLTIEDTEFVMADYQAFLSREAASIEAFQSQQQAAFNAERERWQAQGYDPDEISAPPAAIEPPDQANGTRIDSPVAGSVWKVLKPQGATVSAGEVVMIIESMKTEIEVITPAAGILQQVLAGPGTQVNAGTAVAVLTG